MSKSFYTTHSGAQFLSPGGQSEQGTTYVNAGYRYSMLTITDGHAWSDWSETIKQHTAAGARIIIGGRVGNYGDPLVGIEQILLQGIEHHVPTFLDIEDEFEFISPAKCEAKIRQVRLAHPTYTRETVINTVGWVYNNVDYRPIAHRPVQLQVYVDDMSLAPTDLPHVTNDCIVHARLKGFTDIGVMFQTYHGAQPSWYDFWQGKPRALYTGDQIGAAQAWGQWHA